VEVLGRFQRLYPLYRILTVNLRLLLIVIKILMPALHLSLRHQYSTWHLVRVLLRRRTLPLSYLRLRPVQKAI